MTEATAPTADAETTEETTDAQGDEQEAQGQEGSEEVADSGPSERESALMHLLSHYAPEGLDVEEELAHVIPTEDGGWAYRPAPSEPSEEAAPKPKPRARQSTRRRPATPASTSVGKSATLEERAAAYQTAVKAGGNALNAA